MEPRTKGRLLWGAVGTLSFLVLIQGYELVSAERIAWTVKGVVAVLVGVGAAVLTGPAWAALRDALTDS